MTPYASASGKKSGVLAFEIDHDRILVRFAVADYLYTYRSAGKPTIEKMKKMALAQSGLSSFISRNKPVYEDWFPRK
jgi:hypothetical protein